MACGGPALMPSQGAEDRQAGFEEIEGDAGKGECPPMVFGGAPRPSKLEREERRGRDAVTSPPINSRKSAHPMLEFPRSGSGRPPGRKQEGLEKPPGEFAELDLDAQSSAALWGTLRGNRKQTVFEGQPEKLAKINPRATWGCS